VIAIDAEGKVTLFNPAAERMIGQGSEPLRVGSSAALPPAIAQTLAATLEDGSPRLHIESIIPDPSGRLTPVVLNTSPLTEHEGRVLGAVIVFSDLTKLKELEGEKRRAERLAAWSALAAGIAHEIKNPLVSIKTFAELLPERYTDIDFRENFSKVAIKEIERIDSLVGRLRGLGAPSIQTLHPLDIRQPIEEILSLLVGQLEQTRIRVSKRYEGDLPQISGDHAQLKQVFLNLFMNSLDAMEPGGQLTIRLSTQSGYGRDIVRVEVRDTGKGIPEELLDKIFNPFVTTKHKGSGLGLAICRGIMDSHKATIRAENNPDGFGAALILEFPVTSAKPAAVHS
jgi:two-component system nitrogen regulation sensor histidine kinase GlnL